MKRELGPTWSPGQRAVGEAIRRAWETFFETSSGDEASEAMSKGDARIAEVRARHEAEIMRRANVVGVAEGIRIRRGKPTGQPCIVVYVERKVPRAKLDNGDLIPRQIEGVPVDVVEVGRIEPMLR